MPSNIPVRSTTGCWTCRTRRKKCDESGHPCSTCESLQLVCHGYGPRPEWMDGGTLEKAQAHAFKAVVRRSHIKKKRRRSQDTSSTQRIQQPKPLQSPPRSLDIHIDTQTQDVVRSHDPLTPLLSPDPTQVFNFQPESFDDLESFHSSNFSPDEIDLTFTEISSQEEGLDRLPSLDAFFSTPTTPIPSAQLWKQTSNASDLPRSLSFQTNCVTAPTPSSALSSVLIATQDFAFSAGEKLGNGGPTSHPLHTDSNDWLDLAQHERDALRYYTASVFPKLFPFVTMENSRIICQELVGSGESTLCRAAILAQGVFSQQSQLNRFGLGSGDFEKEATAYEIASFQGLLDLVRYLEQDENSNGEAISSPDAPQCATQILLSQILRGSSDWVRVLELLSPCLLVQCTTQLADSKLGLHFCQYILAFLEILSCTVTGAEPKFAATCLQRLEITNQLQTMSTVTGIESWLLTCVFQITLLRRWKEDQLSRGALSITELVKRASPIEQLLQDYGERLQSSETTIEHSDIRAFTSIYASAASIFLHSTVSDPRPQIPEIKQGVTDTINALQCLPRPDLLNRLGWPVCVAASLADESQYAFFEKLKGRVTEAYGRDENISRALAVARECWALRGGATGGSDGDRCWDWRDGMRAMGGLVLLY